MNSWFSKPHEPILTYNSPIFTLFCLVELDNFHAKALLDSVEQFSPKRDHHFKLTDFAQKYAGKQKQTLIVLYLLFNRLLDFHEEGDLDDEDAHATNVFEELQSKIVLQTIAKATSPNTSAHQFTFFCFLFQLLSISSADSLEYLFWLLTKNERTLDRGEVALLLQVILMEKKDAFLVKYKYIIQRLLVDQGSESIVLNRFQVLNASFGGIFTTSIQELQSILQSTLLGQSFWKEFLNKHLSRLLTSTIASQAAYTQHILLLPSSTSNTTSVDHHEQLPDLAVDATMHHSRHEARKYLRKYLRILHSYNLLKENTTLLFKDRGGGNMFTYMTAIAQEVAGIVYEKVMEPVMKPLNDHVLVNLPALLALPAIPSPASLLLPSQSSNNTAGKNKGKKSKGNDTWLGSLPLLNTKQNSSQQQQGQSAVVEVNPFLHPALYHHDPFAFEKDYAFTLQEALPNLVSAAIERREETTRLLEETEVMMEDLRRHQEILLQMAKQSKSQRLKQQQQQLSQKGNSSSSSRSGRSIKSSYRSSKKNRRLDNEDDDDEGSSHSSDEGGTGGSIQQKKRASRHVPVKKVTFNADGEEEEGLEGGEGDEEEEGEEGDENDLDRGLLGEDDVAEYHDDDDDDDGDDDNDEHHHKQEEEDDDGGEEGGGYKAVDHKLHLEDHGFDDPKGKKKKKKK